MRPIHRSKSSPPGPLLPCPIPTLRYRVCPHELDDIKGSRSVRLGQHHVSLSLEIAVEALEEIFEQQGDQGTSELQPFVAVVILWKEKRKKGGKKENRNEHR